jgi:hypothetical protein
VLDPAGLACDQPAQDLFRPVEIALQEQGAGEGGQRFRASGLGPAQLLQDGAGGGEPMLGRQRLGQAQQRLGCLLRHHRSPAPARFRHHGLAGVEGDAGQFLEGAGLARVQTHECAAVVLGLGEAALGRRVRLTPMRADSSSGRNASTRRQ